MYDYAGEWIYRVGMPAKSGVSGGVLAVLPGQMGIGVFSPLLDARGNSVRGVQVCSDLSREYGLHMLSVPNLGRSPVRVSYDSASVRSKQHRQPEAARVLTDQGGRSRVYELQGDLVFASMESLSRRVCEESGSFDVVAMDFKHVSRLGEGAVPVAVDLLKILVESGKFVALSRVGHLPELGPALADLDSDTGTIVWFPDKDAALEWCEDRLILEVAPGLLDTRVPVSENEICSGLDDEVVARLQSVGGTRTFSAGDTIVRAGDQGDSVYLLVQGRVSVSIDLPGGGSARIATLSAGMTFGEMAMLGESLRSANVRADKDVECVELSMDDLAELGNSDPQARATMYRNLARKIADNLRRANDEVQALSG